MWLPIVFSALLAIVAVRFVLFSSNNELVRVIQNKEDFTVRYPRVYLAIAIVLYAVMASVVLSLIVWQTANIVGIIAGATLGIAGTIYLLYAVVWRIDVRKEYLIFVSSFGVRRMVHYQDISSARLTTRQLVIKTPIKDFKMSSRIIYLENLLYVMADHNVPIFREDS